MVVLQVKLLPATLGPLCFHFQLSSLLLMYLGRQQAMVPSNLGTLTCLWETRLEFQVPEPAPTLTVVGLSQGWKIAA